MSPTGSSLKKTRGGPALAIGILATVVFGLGWGLQQKPLPIPPTSDIYTHLSVARHLARGEGYLSDVAYPLSFAFPFARHLPQPLVHRMPGFGTVLVLPYLLTRDDPRQTLAAVRLLQILLVLLMVGCGAHELWRRGRGVGIPFWLVLMGSLPLLDFAVAWGEDEILVGLILLVIWLALRREASGSPLLVGGLTGLLGLVRLDLFWLPVAWWLFSAPRQTPAGLLRHRFNHAFWLMLAAAITVLLPWSLRTLSLTGQPFFTLQAVAEHAKDTRTFPGYSIYQGLEPQTLCHTLMTDPMPLARKVVRGVRFYFTNLPRFLAWPWLLALMVEASIRGVQRLRHRQSAPASPSGLPLATATTLALIFFYSLFDHSLRHLLPVFPLLTWELAVFSAGPWPVPNLKQGLGTAAILGAAAVAGTLTFPCRLPGWKHAAEAARRQQSEVVQAATAFKKAPATAIFVDFSAVPWLADRPGVWRPPSTKVQARIQDLLKNSS